MNIQEQLQKIAERYNSKSFKTVIEKCPEILEFVETSSKDYSTRTFNEKVYIALYGAPPVNSCGQSPVFESFNRGYKEFCGKKSVCKCAREQQKEKISNYHKNKTHNKKQKTVDRAKETFKKNHGVENPMWSNDIKNKMHQTNLKNHGAPTPFESRDIQEKIEQKNLGIYGVKRPFENPDIIKKAHQTSRQRYGNDFPKIARNAFLKQNNNKNPFQVYHKKSKKSLFKNHGVEHPKKSSLIQQKSIDTLYSNYSVENPNQIHIDLKSLEILNNPDKFQEYCKYYSLKELVDILQVSEKTLWERHDRYNLGIFDRKSRSQYEEEIAGWLDSLNVYYKRNKKIGSKTVDFLIENSLALEFNGLYAHSEYSYYGQRLKMNKHYHSNKFENCKNQNIKLYTIFEDEWNTKKNIIKNKIKIDLNLGTKGIPARKTTIYNINYETAKEFLDRFHIQGGVKSTIYLGVFFDNVLIGAMCFLKKNEQTWELTRFACNFEVHPGVFSKLLKHFQRNYKWNTIESFSDNRWSWGDVYQKHGFEFAKHTKPDYFVTNYQKREHKFNWRKNRIQSRFNIDVSNKTELELTRSLGWDRIWDCGKTKWVLHK